MVSDGGFVARVLADGDLHLEDMHAPWGDRPGGAASFRNQFVITNEGVRLR